MQLVINSYGAYLRKSGNCFLVKREDRSFEVAVSKVSSILIQKSICLKDYIDRKQKHDQEIKWQLKLCGKGISSRIKGLT